MASNRLQPIFAAVIVATLMGCAAMTRAQEPQTQPFSVYWSVYGVVPLDASTAPVNHNFVLFNYHDLGNYPYAGPHIIEQAPGGRQAYMQQHISKLAAGVAAKIPDPQWSGFAAIDWEIWMPYWSGHEDTPSNLGPTAEDRDFITDWRDYIRAARPVLLAGKTPAQQELVFRDTWLDVTREFYLKTLAEVQRLRPNTKWGFYHLPLSPFFAWLSTSDPFQREQLRLLRLAHDEELTPIFDATNALYPSLYIFFQGVPGSPNWQLKQVVESDNEAYLRLNMIEAIRVSRGKPVLPFITVQYHDNEPALRGKWLNPHDLRASITVPRDNGAAGVVLWGWMPNASDRPRWQTHMQDSVFPMIQSTLYPPTNPLGGPTSGGLPAAPGGGGGGVMSFGGSSGAAPTSGVATFSGKSNSAGPGVATFSNADNGRVSTFEFSHSEIEAAIQRMRFGLFRATASKAPQAAPSKTAATPETNPPEP